MAGITSYSQSHRLLAGLRTNRWLAIDPTEYYCKQSRRLLPTEEQNEARARQPTKMSSYPSPGDNVAITFESNESTRSLATARTYYLLIAYQFWVIRSIFAIHCHLWLFELSFFGRSASVLLLLLSPIVASLNLSI